MFCALKNAWGVLLKSSSVAPAKITNTASNITANNLDITANNLNIATQQNTTDLKAGGGDNYSNSHWQYWQ
jgi:hypothetical protein